MFRILVVEDEPNYLETLGENFKEFPPCVRPDFASHVEEGVKYVRVARQQRLPYDGALLDCKIRSSTAAQAGKVMNETICAELRLSMHDCFVLHMTAFANDPGILAHMKSHHGGSRGVNREVRSKADYEAIDLCQQLVTFVISRHTHRLLDRLFVPRPTLRGLGVFPSYAPGLSATHQLQELQSTVSELWDYIDEEARERIQLHFAFAGSLDTRRLSFLPRVG
jgi:hypothetical protein